MRIVIVGTSYPMRGGIAHYVALLYRKLVERGHTVKIISFTRQYPSLFFPGKTQQDHSKEVDSVPNEPVLDSINPISWLKTFKRIRDFGAEAVVFKYWMPFFAPSYACVALLGKVFGGSRTLFVCDNIVPHEHRPGDTLLTRIVLSIIDAFIVQSDVVLSDLLTFKPRAQYALVPHPVYETFKADLTRDEARRRLGLGREDKVALFFGYVRRYKGLSVLFDAFGLLAERKDTKLLVVGEFYEPEKPYTDQIARLGIQEQVMVVNEYVPNEDVGIYFVAADVVVLPYITATQSGILQIAYNFDRPVVVADVGGLAESVDEGRTGYVVAPGDPHVWASALERFFQESKETDFSANVASYKQRFSWDQLAEAIESLLTHEKHR
jgi:glycosyltransferase involved in cell wall biosynthesis